MKSGAEQIEETIKCLSEGGVEEGDQEKIDHLKKFLEMVRVVEPMFKDKESFSEYVGEVLHQGDEGLYAEMSTSDLAEDFELYQTA